MSMELPAKNTISNTEAAELKSLFAQIKDYCSSKGITIIATTSPTAIRAFKAPDGFGMTEDTSFVDPDSITAVSEDLLEVVADPSYDAIELP